MRFALVVEDDEDVAEVLEHHIRRLGFESHLALSGEMAEDMLNQEKWDVIVVDILLPDIDGRELIRRIRATAAGHDVAVVATSILDRYELQEVDADACLMKPFRGADVARAVAEALEQATRRSDESEEA